MAPGQHLADDLLVDDAAARALALDHLRGLERGQEDHVVRLDQVLGELACYINSGS